jgi:hypothetical protein
MKLLLEAIDGLVHFQIMRWSNFIKIYKIGLAL